MSTPASNLYSREILRLATALPHDDRLENAEGTATRRAPICGSEVTAEVSLNNGQIIGIAFRTHACALGQASAALLREHATGMDNSTIVEARAALVGFLNDDDSQPLPWEAMRHFAPARRHPARHGAILLPYDALLAALDGVD
jgi:NifU-like protein involved in Fe-S cluster formation